MARKRRRSHMCFWAVGSVALTATAHADPPSGDGYRLVFADEFNGTSLDTSKWSAASPSWTMPNSNASASAADVSVANGILTLTANRPTTAVSFDSGSVSTYQKFTFTDGYAEARIWLPSTPGSWPAFWGLYTGWPPETDVMEYPLTTNGGTSGLQNYQYNTNYHYGGSSNASAGAGVVTTGTNLSTGWHTFGVDWKSTGMYFYLDGNQVQHYTGDTSQMAYMYMILDYAVGGWPGAPSTSQWAAGHSDKTQIDYVRVWQTNPNSDATSNWNISGGGSFTTSGNWTKGVPAYGNEVAYFGRVGTASTAAITMGSWQMMGGITFDGAAGGTTAYTVGSSSNQIQLAGVNTASTVTVQATSLSTTNQTISAGEELWSNVDFQNNMTGGQTLNLNGNLSGNGNMYVDGVGTTIVSGAGSYAGTTTIGSASGPAVLRANANSALSTGAVVIGSSGNGTTARLELTGGISLPNAISLNGRNNNSVGIENVSGNNVLTNTVAANVGGSVYQIQSDAGQLLLNGSAGGGIALQSNATGSRTFTLQGAGNGLIGGKIQNGSATVSLVEAGTGTWSLSAANTYTGSTTINSGTLQLLGSGAPVASYSFSPASVSGTTVTNAGVGGSTLNATFSANGGTGSINTSTGAFAGTGSLVLKGNGSILDVNSPVTSLANSSSWTVAAWVKTTQAGFTLMNKGTAGAGWGSGNSTFYLGVQGQTGTASGGVPVAVRWGGGWVSGTTSPAVNNGAWHLVAYTDDGTTETVYVDGTAETTTQGFANGDVGNHIRFGIAGQGEGDGTAVSNGSIGAINIYSGALSAAQVQSLYTSNLASVGTTNILPTGSPVALTAAGATLDLEAVNQTVASLSGVGGSSIVLGYKSNLAINSSGEFDGSITGTGGITLPGSISYTLGGTSTAYTGSTTIGSSATLTLPANNSTGGIVTRTIGALTINTGGQLILGQSLSRNTRQLLLTSSPNISGTVDLADNDMIVQGAGPSGLMAITHLIKQAYNNGTWQGSSGILSSTAATSTTHLTTIAAIQNDNGFFAPLFSTFDGNPVADADVLLKYTYYGDSNLDGRVDGSDYTLIDNGYLNNLTGWFNGDFNYDGTINGSDYTLIDNAFNTQGAQLSDSIANPTVSIATEVAAVPEPVSLLLASLALTALSRRRVCFSAAAWRINWRWKLETAPAESHAIQSGSRCETARNF